MQRRGADFDLELLQQRGRTERFNRNGTIDYGGTDRIIKNQKVVPSAQGRTVERTTTSPMVFFP